MDDVEAVKERLTQAVAKRKDYFRVGKESLTLKKARSILEDDLGLKTGALDVLKSDIKALVICALEGDETEHPLNKVGMHTKWLSIS